MNNVPRARLRWGRPIRGRVERRTVAIPFASLRAVSPSLLPVHGSVIGAGADHARVDACSSRRRYLVAPAGLEVLGVLASDRRAAAGMARATGRARRPHDCDGARAGRARKGGCRARPARAQARRSGLPPRRLALAMIASAPATEHVQSPLHHVFDPDTNVG